MEHVTRVSDAIELCHESFGDPDDPTVLLVMGLGMQMIAWDDDLCAQLAGLGLHVLRFDNRDTGRSTHLTDRGAPTTWQLLRRDPRAVAYRLDDLADDAAGLLDRLGIAEAHVVGASMGGMIAQLIAIRHPRRVRSLVSIMSTTGHRLKGQPALSVLRFFVARPPRTRDEAAERVVRLFRAVGSSAYPLDEPRLRATAARSFDRGGGDASGTARQLAAILAARDRAPDLRRLTVPALVVHGTDDRLVRPSGGRATARAIPGARLLMVKGMGHDLPRGAWPQVTEEIAATIDRATALAGDRRTAR